MGRYKPYVVVSPDFQITSGGIRVMWALYGWLLAKGQIAFLNTIPQNTDFIAIYPEIYQGNPTYANHVVRYLLNKPGVMRTNGVAGPTIFDKTDQIWTFSQLYNVSPYKVYDRHILFLPVCNTHLFKVTNKDRRNKSCKLIGKGRDLHLKETEGLFEITRPFANDQAALADYLNECDIMYSYDNNSAMFEIARLCGCRVKIIPSIYTKDEFKNYEPGMNGISYGLEEDVPLDAPGFRKHYTNLIGQFSHHLSYFIEETQND
jgi:O-antigen biosynthesis protein